MDIDIIKWEGYIILGIGDYNFGIFLYYYLDFNLIYN